MKTRNIMQEVTNESMASTKQHNEAIASDAENALQEVMNAFMQSAKQRNGAISSSTEKKAQEDTYDVLMTPLVYQAHDGPTYYGLQLPQCFPTMTEPDMLYVLEWYVQEGSFVRTGQDLLEVHSNFGDIVVPLFPSLRGTYRVVQTMKAQNERIQMGDVFIILQTVASQTGRRRKSTKRKAA
jgi:hypothetical protein